MDINGCHIVGTLCEDNPEGFSLTVSREIVTSSIVDGKQVESSTKVTRGPFTTIYAATKYALSWKKEDAANPPPVPDPEPIDPMSVKPEEKAERPATDPPHNNQSQGE